jgi:hypothetical protein
MSLFDITRAAKVAELLVLADHILVERSGGGRNQPDSFSWWLF